MHVNSTKLLMTACKRLLFLACVLWFSGPLLGQRTFKTASVLATGTWYKTSVPAAGIYKFDPAFFAIQGINGSLPSAQIRLFAAGNGMLPERAGETHIDDLEELAIAVSDGGDGQLNGNDFILFYAEGPHKWSKDSAARRFTHRKNLYAEKAYYFITIGGNGKRITTQTNPPAAVVSTTTFDERYFHEQDSVNFLSSRKAPQLQDSIW